MINILLFGPPGAGKGTQAELLVARYGLVQISTGSIIRDEIASGTELGKRAEQEMAGGNLASDEIVISIIKEFIENTDTKQGIIFDGFPRTLAQAEALDTLLKYENRSVSALISLEVPKEELIRRMVERGKSSGRTDDGSVEIMRKRLDVYEEFTRIVKGYYKNQDKCVEIDGTKSIDDVTAQICNVIGEF